MLYAAIAIGIYERFAKWKMFHTTCDVNVENSDDSTPTRNLNLNWLQKINNYYVTLAEESFDIIETDFIKRDILTHQIDN